MKKVLIFLALALATTLSINAQDDNWNNEIAISYGLGAFTDVNSSFLGGIFSGKQTSYIGAFGAEYFYRPKANLGVGLVATFGTCKWSASKDARSKYMSIMPAVKYNWLNRDRFSMYSKAALGVVIGFESDNNKNHTKAAVSWQATAVGAEYGKAFRGFLELGFGEQGILVAGLRLKF